MQRVYKFQEVYTKDEMLSMTKPQVFLDRQAETEKVLSVYDFVEMTKYNPEEVSEMEVLYKEVGLKGLVKDDYVYPNYVMTLADYSVKKLNARIGKSILQNADYEDFTSSLYTNFVSLCLNSEYDPFTDFEEFHFISSIVASKLLRRVAYSQGRNAIKHVKSKDGAWVEKHHEDIQADFFIRNDKGDNASWEDFFKMLEEETEDKEYKAEVKAEAQKKHEEVAKKKLEEDKRKTSKVFQSTETLTDIMLAKLESTLSPEEVKKFQALLLKKASEEVLNGTERSQLSRLTSKVRIAHKLDTKEERKAKAEAKKLEAETRKAEKKYLATLKLAHAKKVLLEKIDRYLNHESIKETYPLIEAKAKLEEVSTHAKLNEVRSIVADYERQGRKDNQKNVRLAKKIARRIEI